MDGFEYIQNVEVELATYAAARTRIPSAFSTHTHTHTHPGQEAFGWSAVTAIIPSHWFSRCPGRIKQKSRPETFSIKEHTPPSPPLSTDESWFGTAHTSHMMTETLSKHRDPSNLLVRTSTGTSKRQRYPLPGRTGGQSNWIVELRRGFIGYEYVRDAWNNILYYSPPEDFIGSCYGRPLMPRGDFCSYSLWVLIMQGGFWARQRGRTSNAREPACSVP